MAQPIEGLARGARRLGSEAHERTPEPRGNAPLAGPPPDWEAAWRPD